MVIHRDTCMAMACTATAAGPTFGFFTALAVFSAAGLFVIVLPFVVVLPLSILLALGGPARACAPARLARARTTSST